LGVAGLGIGVVGAETEARRHISCGKLVKLSYISATILEAQDAVEAGRFIQVTVAKSREKGCCNDRCWEKVTEMLLSCVL
jgi:hypothetical protein